MTGNADGDDDDDDERINKKPQRQKLERKWRVAAIDESLETLLEQSKLHVERDNQNRDDDSAWFYPYYHNTNIFIGTRHAMNDYLFQDAIRLFLIDDDGKNNKLDSIRHHHPGGSTDHPDNTADNNKTTNTIPPPDSKIVDRIVHAIMACEQGSRWLHYIVNKRTNLHPWLLRPIMNVLLLGEKISHVVFSTILVALLEMDSKIRVVFDSNNTRVGTTFDLTDEYCQVPTLSFFLFHNSQVGKEANEIIVEQYADGVYQLFLLAGKGDKNDDEFTDNVTCVLVPHEQGVKYFVQKDLSVAGARTAAVMKCRGNRQLIKKMMKNVNSSKSKYYDIHSAQRHVIDKLIRKGCDPILAWRLLAKITKLCLDAQAVIVDFEGFWNVIINAFHIVSGFRTEIHHLVDEQYYELSKKRQASDDKGDNPSRTPTKQDLHYMIAGPSSGGGREQAYHDYQLFITPQRELVSRLNMAQIGTTATSLINNKSALMAFTADFVELDHTQFHLELIGKIISKIKKSQQELPETTIATTGQLSLHSLAILGALNGQDARTFLASKNRGLCCYQDDEDAKGLYIPTARGNLLLFATTKELDVDQIIHDGVQSPICGADGKELHSLVALRAAFEFDPWTRKGATTTADDDDDEFQYDTEEFQRANALLNEGTDAFVNDSVARFRTFFDNSPNKVYVSHLRQFCDRVAARLGASSAWLLREMISLYVANGATVAATEGAGPNNRKDGYGQMERAVKKAENGNTPLPSSSKTLIFDEKVDIQGFECRVWKTRKFTFECDEVRVLLKFQGRQHGPKDYETAMQWLKQGIPIEMEVRPIDGDWSFTCLPFSKHYAEKGTYL